MFNDKELKALDAAKVGTSGRMAYALIIYKQQYDTSGCTYDFLSAQMGVSLDRAQRVVADLRKAGLVTVAQDYKQPAIISLTDIKHESDPD